jgi:hypothetical protein
MTSVLISKPSRKGRRSRPLDPHDFGSIGSVLRRMRWGAEAEMTENFSHPLSLRLDFLLALEQHDAEACDDCA